MGIFNNQVLQADAEVVSAVKDGPRCTLGYDKGVLEPLTQLSALQTHQGAGLHRQQDVWCKDWER